MKYPEIVKAMADAISRGERKTVREWADLFGVTVNTIYNMTRIGTTLREALANGWTHRQRASYTQRTTNGVTDKQYTKLVVRIGKRDLCDAGLIGRQIRKTVERGRIIIDTDTSTTLPNG